MTNDETPAPQPGGTVTRRCVTVSLTRRQQHGHATARDRATRRFFVLAVSLCVLCVLCVETVCVAARPPKPAPPPKIAPPTVTIDPRAAAGRSLLVLPIGATEEGLAVGVREALNFKAKRLGAVVYDPSSVGDALGGERFTVDTPPEKLAALGREKFQADLVVVGRVTGDSKACQITLMAVATDDAKGERVFRKTYVCPQPQYRGIEMARAVYEILSLPAPDDPLRMLQEDPEIARRWRDGPNLVRNPGFELPNADATGPADWQEVEKEMAWAPNPDSPGKVLKFDMTPATAVSYGLDYYSDWIPIEPGAVYRFECRYKSLGPAPRIFLKGYHEFEKTDLYPAQRRETYRRQVHPAANKGRWSTVTADFVPDSTTPAQRPTFLKVDLYAYLHAGVILWDDVVLKKVRDAPAAKN